MKIIFDFDNTLFSTKRFYYVLVESFKEIGISEELFRETFKESEGGGDLYNKEKHFDLIVKNKPGINYELLRKKWEEALNRSDRFLYIDTLSFLGKFKKEHDLYILSYGMENVQRGKIEKSKIKHFFKKVYITKDVSKTSALNKFLGKTEKAVFVDDNPEALSKIKKEFPKIITVRISRREGKYKNYPDNPEIDFPVKSLKELEKILWGLT